MAKQIKIDLNKVTHSVRAAQAVLQYGVGAMVDFPDQTLVTAAPEYWSGHRKIYDDRLAKALGVDYFGLPTNIAYFRFPEWYFCPKCRTFQPLKDWIAQYKVKAGSKLPKPDPYMAQHMQCPKCKQDLVVARIVTVCENGHLNDFPWIEWVHVKAKKPICAHPELKFKTGASATEGLEGLIVSCSCGAGTTLKGAFDKDAFETADEDRDESIFRCKGGHPFRHSEGWCECYPKTVQRGASSVYFPIVYSSLVIPPYADKLYAKIEKSKAFDDCITIINDEEDKDEKLATIKKKLSKWAEKISSEIDASVSDVEKILTRKWLEPASGEIDVTGTQYKIAEYLVLSGELESPTESPEDFLRESINVQEYDIPHVKSVSLVEKVRVVNALIGFSRLNPVTHKKDKGFVSVKEQKTRWYPAYEVRGEGIFIEFNQEDINSWITNHPSVIERVQRIAENCRKSFIGQNHSQKITPKFIMLHTLSHLLISRLSFECGYSIASLSERLYCSEADDGKNMAGILIYTASGDSEGTLGGLVRQGHPDTLPRIFKKAIKNARVCSNDPVCIMSKGQGRDSLNLAACYACGLLPETCCEQRNAFLDRGMIVGTYDEPQIGFWKELL